MGQFGFTDPADPRYVIAFSDTSQSSSSRVSGCSFSHSTSTSIGLINSAGIDVSDNLIWRNIGDAIRLIGVGQGNAINNNLIFNTLHYLLETPNGGDLHFSKFKHFPAAIKAFEATESILMRGNYVSGVEGFGYRLRGDTCEEKSEACTTSEVSIDYDTMNYALGAHHGVNVWLETQPSCSKISNFAAIRNFDYGIYMNGPSSMIIDSVVVFDNPVGVLPFIIRPPAMKHSLIEKSFTLRNSLIGGLSDTFDCSELNSNFRFKEKMKNLRAPTDTGLAGYQLCTFMGDANRSPIEQWATVWSECQILGRSCLDGNIFAGFGNACGIRSTAISTNVHSPDHFHTTFSSNNRMLAVDDEFKFYIHRPKLEWVTSEENARCIDMDCDAAKKVLIKVTIRSK